ncbi:MAG: lamin tail domain-containing protein [bacterium]|nr:lamin tail domain-containing protein [bacterium]
MNTASHAMVAWRALLFVLFTFVAACAPNLTAAMVVNEIVYKDNAAYYNSGDWVELFNSSANPTNIGGWIVMDSGGHSYTNPPDTTVPAYGYVVVYGSAKFPIAYPSVTNRVGPSNISLGSNDAVIIITSSGVVEDEVKYECGSAGWPYAYGTGRSIALLYPYESNQEAANWQASTALGGSPGAMNPGAVGMRVTEHNRTPDGPTSSQQVNIAIQAKDAFFSITSVTANVDWGGGYQPSPMTALPSDQYSITLPPTNNGRLVRYYFTLRNNAGQRYDAWWSSTNEPYLYVVDDAPDYSGFVINEIMYNSSNLWLGGGYEYVEIFNTRTSAVNISYWQFRDSSDKFRLPAAVSVPAGGYIVLADDTQAVLGVYGPWPTNALLFSLPELGLANSGEVVKWQDANGISLNQLTYDDAPPWPTQPDGHGPSLELMDPALDNQLPQSWAAATQFGTPGYRNSVTPEPCGMLVSGLVVWSAIRCRRQP